MIRRSGAFGLHPTPLLVFQSRYVLHIGWISYPVLTLDMADQASLSRAAKRCFVTIGATAPFNSLIKAVLEPGFVTELRRAGYTELRIQYGDHEGEEIFRARAKELREWPVGAGFDITGFGFNKTGLREELTAVKGRSSEDEGMVISHAGQSVLLRRLRWKPEEWGSYLTVPCRLRINT